MRSKKILVLAYAISPTRGSEYSVAWNYVTNMSKDNELVVLYGMSGNHMGDIEEIEQFKKNSSLTNVRFIVIKPNKIANILNALNKKGILVYTFYLAYNVWHKQAYKKAKKIVSQEKFDLIHYLGPNGFREPGYLWKINLPYIWGPIGGIPNRPKQLFRALHLKSKIAFSLRNLINTFQFRHNPRLRKAFQRTNLLLTATTENQKIIKDFYNTDSTYLPENGIINPIPKILLTESITIKDTVINIFWIGRIDANKSLIILLTALSKVNYSNWHLHVVGEGSLKVDMQNLSIQLKIKDNITWHGQIPRSKVFKLLEMAHLNVITSLGEGNPTTIWEAMSLGVPTITLDHCGMHDTICEKCGVKIPIHTYEQVVNDLATHLGYLIKNPNEIKKISDGVIQCAKKYTWSHRRDFFNKAYDIAIENWNKKRGTKND